MTVSLIIGASLQVAVVFVLVPTLGIVGFAVGAVTGRLVSLGLLSRGVAQTVSVPARSGMTLLVTVGIVLVLQRMNEDPPETVGVRIVVALLAISFGMWKVATSGRAILDVAGHGRGRQG